MAYIYNLTDTWNAAGTTWYGIKLDVTNTASSASSRLASLRIGGVEKFGIDKNGAGIFAGDITLSDSAPILNFGTGGAGAIGPNTADTTDTGAVTVRGGGSTSATRGGYFTVYGNENGTFGGGVLLAAGSGGYIRLASDTRIGTAATPTCRLDVDGGITTSKTAVTAPVATDGNIYSGNYTPTNIAGSNANVASLTITLARYSRVGNMVTVTGSFSLTPTAANTNTTFLFSLPVGAAFTSTTQGNGTAISYTTATREMGAFRSDTGSVGMLVKVYPTATAAVSYSYVFEYEVQ